MFRTSPVHHQERFVQAVFADLVCGNTRTTRHVQPLQSSSYNFVTAGRVDISYATLLKTAHSPVESTKPQPQHRTTYQQQQTPSIDINELKVMMKGFMEQMAAMLCVLTAFVSKMALNGYAT